MAGYDIEVRVVSATKLNNVKRSGTQNPIAVVYTDSHMKFASAPAHVDGVNPRWNESFRFVCEASCYSSATLTIDLWHQGKSYDRFIGTVENIPLLTLLSSPGPITWTKQVVNNGVGGGCLKFIVGVARRTPAQRMIHVSQLSAKNLKNAKKPWQRLSFRKPHIRKMSPYVVVSIDLSEERAKVSPAVEFGGRDPVFIFDSAFRCDESRLTKSEKVALTVELYHRHKVEINPVMSTSDGASPDKHIGTARGIVEMPPKSMWKAPYNFYVRTPKGKARGTLSVSVEYGELVLQSSDPLPTTASWAPRIRPPKGRVAAKTAKILERARPWFATGAAVAPIAIGIAGIA